MVEIVQEEPLVHRTPSLLCRALTWAGAATRETAGENGERTSWQEEPSPAEKIRLELTQKQETRDRHRPLVPMRIRTLRSSFAVISSRDCTKHGLAHRERQLSSVPCCTSLYRNTPPQCCRRSWRRFPGSCQSPLFFFHTIQSAALKFQVQVYGNQIHSNLRKPKTVCWTNTTRVGCC